MMELTQNKTLTFSDQPWFIHKSYRIRKDRLDDDKWRDTLNTIDYYIGKLEMRYYGKLAKPVTFRFRDETTLTITIVLNAN